ncbi:cache domain-containing sensor histidine kinase [Cohnella fermenti]|uniref:histidine kinase n=1 Tax=Cohnella fermenti TaxID=2565925 RepID=A0A4S4BNV8_9BACL|nr:sensor histidine kinase [Cohnella fermenti]THF76566.1 sensor histidine kinase [Cohnella fermenti]
MRRGAARQGGLGRVFHRFSIPRQWLLAYLLLIVVPAGVFLYGYYERSGSILRSEVIRTTQQALKQAASNLSYRLEHIEDIGNAAFMNANLHDYLAVGADDQSIAIQLEVIKDLRYLVTTVQTNSDVFRVRLFVDRSKIYSGERINFFALDSLKDRPWYDPIIAAGGRIVWTGDYRESYLDAGEQSIFSAARMLRDPHDYDKVSGVLMIDVREDMVSDILSTLQLAPGTQVYLTDAEGTIVYHTDRSKVGTEVDRAVGEAISRGSEGSAAIKVGGVASDVLYASLSPNGWKLVAQGTESQLSRRAVELSQRAEWTSLLEYVALFLMLPFLLLAIIVRGMNRRVNQVITVIRKEGSDGLNDLPPVNGDFHLLERSVDNLIMRVRTLMEEKYRVRIQEREAQLRALQAQINPHFLYNTLDTINWIAIGKGATDISQMIDRMAKYFRLSLNRGKDIVSVEDELQLAEVYLEIQRSRFPNTFDFQLDVQAGAESCRMPKLILQPIVENALLHGIRKKKDKRGTIRIDVRLEQDELLLSVSDDGIGMDEEQVRRLLTEAPSEREGADGGLRVDGGGSSYGLFNVNERIMLYAGDEYGLSIRSAPGAGTTVTVRLKANREDEAARGAKMRSASRLGPEMTAGEGDSGGNRGFMRKITLAQLDNGVFERFCAKNRIRGVNSSPMCPNVCVKPHKTLQLPPIHADECEKPHKIANVIGSGEWKAKKIWLRPS